MKAQRHVPSLRHCDGLLPVDGENARLIPDRYDTWSPDEDTAGRVRLRFHGRNQAELVLEGVELTSETIAADCDIDPAKGLDATAVLEMLGHQDEPSAGSKYGASAPKFYEWLEEIVDPN